MEQNCNNVQDPISLENLKDIPNEYLYTISCFGKNNCYDIRDLIQYLNTGNKRDPLCGIPLPNEILQNIYTRANELGLNKNRIFYNELEYEFLGSPFRELEPYEISDTEEFIFRFENLPEEWNLQEYEKIDLDIIMPLKLFLEHITDHLYQTIYSNTLLTDKIEEQLNINFINLQQIGFYITLDRWKYINIGNSNVQPIHHVYQSLEDLPQLTFYALLPYAGPSTNIDLQTLDQMLIGKEKTTVENTYKIQKVEPQIINVKFVKVPLNLDVMVNDYTEISEGIL